MDSSSGLNNASGDPALIANIVNYIKSEGIFDEMRRQCLSDVDTKPAFQNLKQRVEGFSSNFLSKIVWRPDLNKNQLRNTLRTELNNSGMMAHGLDHLVDQVVRQKTARSFLPRIKDVFYKYTGLQNPDETKPAPIPSFPFHAPPPYASRNEGFIPPENSRRITDQQFKPEAGFSNTNISSEKKVFIPMNEGKRENESSSPSDPGFSPRRYGKPNTKLPCESPLDEIFDNERKNAAYSGAVEKRLPANVKPSKGDFSSEKKETEDANPKSSVLPNYQRRSRDALSLEVKKSFDSAKSNSDSDKNISTFDKLLQSENLNSSFSPKSSTGEYSNQPKDVHFSKSDSIMVKSSSKCAEESELSTTSSSKDISDSRSDTFDGLCMPEKRQKFKHVDKSKDDKRPIKKHFVSEESTIVRTTSDSSDSESEFMFSSPLKMPDIESFKIFSCNKASELNSEQQKNDVSSSSEQHDDFEKEHPKRAGRTKTASSSDHIKKRKEYSSLGVMENQSSLGQDESKGRLSDVTVSSVHTSDLSSYDDRISLSSAAEEEADVNTSTRNVSKIGRRRQGEESRVGNSETADDKATKHASVSKKISLRRKRKINPKYTSDEFSSIFSDGKSKSMEPKRSIAESVVKSSCGDSKKPSEDSIPANSNFSSSSSSSDETSGSSSSRTQISGSSRNSSNWVDTNNSDSSKSKWNPSLSTQRYDSSDLYKPRANVHSKRRSRKNSDDQAANPRKRTMLKRKRTPRSEDDPRKRKKRH